MFFPRYSGASGSDLDCSPSLLGYSPLSIYRSPKGKEVILSLKDQNWAALGLETEDQHLSLRIWQDPHGRQWTRRRATYRRLSRRVHDQPNLLCLDYVTNSTLVVIAGSAPFLPEQLRFRTATMNLSQYCFFVFVCATWSRTQTQNDFGINIKNQSEMALR